mmetsp:Transcript_8417/g.17425  ORF Transcript_8417/g.17425 Transcript_8417/m.17425 type:complete len:106 (+) Transcript_8417:3-320(+)
MAHNYYFTFILKTEPSDRYQTHGNDAICFNFIEIDSDDNVHHDSLPKNNHDDLPPAAARRLRCPFVVTGIDQNNILWQAACHSVSNTSFQPTELSARIKTSATVG